MFRSGKHARMKLRGLSQRLRDLDKEDKLRSVATAHLYYRKCNVEGRVRSVILWHSVLARNDNHRKCYNLSLQKTVILLGLTIIEFFFSKEDALGCFMFSYRFELYLKVTYIQCFDPTHILLILLYHVLCTQKIGMVYTYHLLHTSYMKKNIDT